MPQFVPPVPTAPPPFEDLRVWLTRSSQAVLDHTTGVRGTKAELLHAEVNVEPAGYSRGYFTADIRYYYRITADAYNGGGRPAEIQGLAVFDKRVTLFGSEGSAMIFSSRNGACAVPGTNLPEAVVEEADPIALTARLAAGGGHGPAADNHVTGPRLLMSASVPSG